jgi:hypothetical protein
VTNHLSVAIGGRPRLLVGPAVTSDGSWWEGARAESALRNSIFLDPAHVSKAVSEYPIESYTEMIPKLISTDIASLVGVGR